MHVQSSYTATSRRLNRFTEFRDFRTVKYWLADVSIDSLTFFITWLAVLEGPKSSLNRFVDSGHFPTVCRDRENYLRKV